jgi:hypothetical protein
MEEHMNRAAFAAVLGLWCVLALAVAARADRQVIAPGTGSQVSVVIDAGANGICETSARGDDVQVLPVGQSVPFTTAVRCGPNKVVDTAAAGDDRQLVGVGAACPNANTDVIDTGPDGIANTPVAGDDDQIIVVGKGTANTPCLLTGPNSLADTGGAAGGDDVRLLAVNSHEPNTPVIRCGANRTAESFANNVRAGGDDIQVVAVGDNCGGASTVVVDSGANGIAETRAQGAELVMSRALPARVIIRHGRNTASLRLKVAVLNAEFGTTAPATRTFSLVGDDGSCPAGTVSQIDADPRTPGLQPTASVSRGRRIKGSAVVTFEVGDVTSVDRDIPFRCSVTLTAQATDTAPAADDASNTTNNTARIELEVVDLNDL